RGGGPGRGGGGGAGDRAGVRRHVSYALRTSAAAVVPAACSLLALAVPLMTVVFRYGATTGDDIRAMSWTLMAFAPGLVALSGQYVCTRAFYALRDTRTPFFLNLVIAALNAGLSLTAYHVLPTRWAVTGMAAAYSLALWAGWAVTAYALRRRLGGASGGAFPALARLLVAAVPAAGYGLFVADGTAVAGPVVAGLAGAATILATFALLARPLRLTELQTLLTSARTRLRP
ncbi:lipid II flippase MurJ, partial [Streptomyces sp. NPDC057540]|uniref:lipid II flippase MurJ n=1 Tax=Streptomyces sp. NPDC057540 TaxID=3346160 RepID=UPI0036C9ECDE